MKLNKTRKERETTTPHPATVTIVLSAATRDCLDSAVVTLRKFLAGQAVDYTLFCESDGAVTMDRPPSDAARRVTKPAERATVKG